VRSFGDNGRSWARKRAPRAANNAHSLRSFARLLGRSLKSPVAAPPLTPQRDLKLRYCPREKSLARDPSGATRVRAAAPEVLLVKSASFKTPDLFVRSSYNAVQREVRVYSQATSKAAPEETRE
jgi:hypothetical protein